MMGSAFRVLRINKGLRQTAGCSRSVSGVAVTVFVLVLTVTFIIPAALFAFEVARVNLASEQLHAATDAAALAAAATVASCSASVQSSEEIYEKAKQQGLNIFRENTVLGVTMRNTQVVEKPYSPGQAGSATISFKFNKKCVTAESTLDVLPAFCTIVGMRVFPVSTHARAGWPGVDVAICLDVSDSMAGDTPITLIRRRYEDASQTKVVYEVVKKTIISGTDLLPATGAPCELCPISGYNFNPVLRSVTGRDAGGAPGSVPYLWNDYTDVVVDMNTQEMITALAKDATLRTVFAKAITNNDRHALAVEISRGNLENPIVFNASKAYTRLAPLMIGPQPGLKLAFERFARKNMAPFQPSLSAVNKFLDNMDRNADARFCLVTFSGKASSKDFSSGSYFEISHMYPGEGDAPMVLPYVALSSSGSGNNAEAIKNVLLDADQVPMFSTSRGTNTPEALKESLTMLSEEGQEDSRKAILLITDGIPIYNDGTILPGYPFATPGRHHWSAIPDTFAQARAARKAGIPIFCIGFLQDKTPSLKEKGARVLSKVVENAGNGSKFYKAENVEELRIALGEVARQLVALRN